MSLPSRHLFLPVTPVLAKLATPALSPPRPRACAGLFKAEGRAWRKWRLWVPWPPAPLLLLPEAPLGRLPRHPAAKMPRIMIKGACGGAIPSKSFSRRLPSTLRLRVRTRRSPGGGGCLWGLRGGVVRGLYLMPGPQLSEHLKDRDRDLTADYPAGGSLGSVNIC